MIARCLVCGRFSWEPLHGNECVPMCKPSRTPAPAAFWRPMLDPGSPLIAQPEELRQMLMPMDGTRVYDVMFHAAGITSLDATDALDGVGLILTQIAADFAGCDETVDAITLRLQAKFDKDVISRLWSYAALLQGLAAGRLPARLYLAVHDLAHEVLVPDAAHQLLGHITPAPWTRLLRPFTRTI